MADDLAWSGRIGFHGNTGPLPKGHREIPARKELPHAELGEGLRLVGQHGHGNLSARKRIQKLMHPCIETGLVLPPGLVFTQKGLQALRSQVFILPVCRQCAGHETACPTADEIPIGIHGVSRETLIREYPIHGVRQIRQSIEQGSVHIKNDSFVFHDDVLIQPEKEWRLEMQPTPEGVRGSGLNPSPLLLWCRSGTRWLGKLS
jgi:hypothetical protein